MSEFYTTVIDQMKPVSSPDSPCSSVWRCQLAGPYALELFEQTPPARQRVVGPDHPDTLASTNNLGEVRRELDEPQS